MASPQCENGYLKIANEIMEALARTRIPGEARQVLDVIIRKTYGFNKKSDSIATLQFMELTNLSARAIHRARYKLKNMNIITVTQKGNSQVLSYEFQKNYHKWQLLPKKDTVTQKGNRCNPKRSPTVTQKAIHKRHKDNIQKTTTPLPPLKGGIEFPDWFPVTTFKDFQEMRKKARKPLTDKAIVLLIKKIGKFKKEGYDPQEVLEQSIINGWQGIFPVKKEKGEDMVL